MWLKLYLYIKAYLEKISARIISFKFKIIAKLPIVSILFYKYKKIRYGAKSRKKLKNKVETFRPETG